MADQGVETEDHTFEGCTPSTIAHQNIPEAIVMEIDNNLLQSLISQTTEVNASDYEDATMTVTTNHSSKESINRIISHTDADQGPTTSSLAIIQHEIDNEMTILSANPADQDLPATSHSMLEDEINNERTILTTDHDNDPPTSSHSTLENEINNEMAGKRGKKRRRQPEQWERNVRKTKRQAGQEYISSKGQVIGPKYMTEVDCSKCPYKCSSKFPESIRQSIFDSFWHLTDQCKLAFYAKYTEKIEKKRKRTENEISRRSFTYNYFFESEGVQNKVCQRFFLSTLGISHSRIKWFYMKHVDSQNGVPTPVRHGQFCKYKIAEQHLEKVRQHISSFPTVESHYCRERTQRLYLEAKLNVALMYDLYKDMCAEKEEFAVKQHKYREIFNLDFNISFLKPKSDRCDTCEAFKMETEKGKMFSQEEIEKIDRHKFLKVDAQEERERDRKSNLAVLSFDLENVLSLPRANVSSFYYRRKLSVYNLTVHSSLDKAVYCCIWHEADMGRGGNAIASALIKALEKFVEKHPTVTDIILWSDSCVPQNRNSFMAYGLMAFMKKYPHILSITQKYSESGHSMIQEVDNAHSAIERHLRCCETYSPVSLVRQLLSVRRDPKLTVLQMRGSDFLNFDDSKLMNYQKVPFSAVKQLKYEKNKMNFVSFKTCHNPEKVISCVKILKDERKSRSMSKSVAPPPHFVPSLSQIKQMKSVNSLSKEKILDLQAMFVFMPAIDVQFYESIIKNKDNQTPRKR